MRQFLQSSTDTVAEWSSINIVQFWKHEIINFLNTNYYNNNSNNNHLWPFERDYPGEPVPEETSTHPDHQPSPSASSIHQYPQHPLFQFMRQTVPFK